MNILNKYLNTNALKSTIIKVSHHGSKTSSSEEFLKKVNPRIALIGVGENNKFGHPNARVIKSLQDINCRIYRTDKMGEIEITISKEGNLKIKSIY